MEYLNTTNTNNEIKYIGLNNQECKNPEFYCRSHKVYLSAEDVKKKRCMCRLTRDMMFEEKCKWLMTIKEFEEYEAKRKEATSAYDHEYRQRKRANNG